MSGSVICSSQTLQSTPPVNSYVELDWRASACVWGSLVRFRFYPRSSSNHIWCYRYHIWTSFCFRSAHSWEPNETCQLTLSSRLSVSALLQLASYRNAGLEQQLRDSTAASHRLYPPLSDVGFASVSAVASEVERLCSIDIHTKKLLVDAPHACAWHTLSMRFAVVYL